VLLAAACTPPAVIKRAEPAYPRDARQNPDGMPLTAKLRVVLKPDGTVSAASITGTTGILQFDTSAIEAVKNWLFSPTRTGCAGDEDNVVTVTFPHGPLPQGPYDPCAHDALVMKQVTPEFPFSARNLDRRPRQVRVQVAIDSNGDLLSASIVQSSGIKALDDASIEAARASTYSPKFVNCMPVSATYTFLVTFDPN
jgi:TonB family protein